MFTTNKSHVSFLDSSQNHFRGSGNKQHSILRCATSTDISQETVHCWFQNATYKGKCRNHKLPV